MARFVFMTSTLIPTRPAAARRGSRFTLLAGLAIGATVLATQVVSGAGTGTESVFVPITPCRLLDTRPTADNVGPRATKIGNGETATFTAWGTGDDDSPCDIPSTATAIATNTVVLAPTARGFLTLFPGDVANPGTANLNFVADQPPTPNSANIPLSSNGTFNVFNAFGEVHVVIDVNGYYQPSSAVGAQGPKGDPGPTGQQGQQGQQGPVGPAGTGRPTFGDPLTTFTNTSGGGFDAAISLDATGLPIVSHRNGSSLYVDRCTSANCLTYVRATLTDARVAPTSIRATSTGNTLNVAALYEQASTDDVRLAMCGPTTCLPRLIQEDSRLGSNSALAISENGFPMAVSRRISGGLVLTRCVDAFCLTTSAVNLGTSSGGASITTDGAGRPVISHYRAGSVEVIVCDDEACADPTRNTVATAAGSRSTVKIGTDGNPRIVFAVEPLVGDASVVLATCTDALCAASTTRTIADPAAAASLVVMPDGRPVVTVSRSPEDGQRTHICDDSACTTDTELDTQTLSPVASTSLTLGPTGNPLFAMDLEGDLAVGAISWPSWSPDIGEH